MKYSLDQLDQTLSSNVLLVGRPGTGKTRSLYTLHKLKGRKWLKGSKLFIADFDRGCQPLYRQAKLEGWASDLDVRRYYNDSGSKIETLKASPARSKDMFLNFANDINTFFDMLGPDKQWRPDKIAEAPYAIVIDSATRFADHVLSFTLALRNKELGQQGVDGRAEFGLQMGKIVETIRSLADLPCLTIITAHEQIKAEMVKTASKDQGGNPHSTGKDWRLPVFTGQLANSIAGEFGVVLYTDIEPPTTSDGQSTYKWFTRPIDNIYCAKTRLRDGLPAKVVQDFNVVFE